MLEVFAKDLLLLELLGTGGMGEVYRATQYGLEGFAKTIAVKRILPQFAVVPAFREMFYREARLAALLNHPNIIQVYSSGQHNSYLYLVMEYVFGENLRVFHLRHKETGRLIPPEVCVYIMMEVAKGLQYAHTLKNQTTGQTLNLVHRDLTAHNIMLGFEGEVKIVDFGIAREVNQADVTEVTTLKGKVSYMSPEQMAGHRLDGRSDIFTLGIVLWELLTLKQLFAQEENAAKLMMNRGQVASPSTVEPKVPESLSAIVQKALQLDRDQRYATAADFGAALSHWLKQNSPDFSTQKYVSYLQQQLQKELVSKNALMEQLRTEVSYRYGKDIPDEIKRNLTGEVTNGGRAKPPPPSAEGDSTAVLTATVSLPPKRSEHTSITLSRVERAGGSAPITPEISLEQPVSVSKGFFARKMRSLKILLHWQFNPFRKGAASRSNVNPLQVYLVGGQKGRRTGMSLFAKIVTASVLLGALHVFLIGVPSEANYERGYRRWVKWSESGFARPRAMLRQIANERWREFSDKPPEEKSRKGRVAH